MLFDMAEVLSKQPRPRGANLAIITENAGGPAVLSTTDMLITSGGQLAELTLQGLLWPPTIKFCLPPGAITIRWTSSATPARIYTPKPSRSPPTILAPTASSVILTPQAMTDATATAEKLKPYARLDGKPILASWMGADAVVAGEDILNAANIPTFKDTPDRAARRRLLLHVALRREPARPFTRRRCFAPRVGGRGLGPSSRRCDVEIHSPTGPHASDTEAESKHLLAAYGIPVVQTHVATSENEAVRYAAVSLGFPVVLKLHSETITHKTDVGGVQLNLRTASAVRRAWRAHSNVRGTHKAGPRNIFWASPCSP